MVDVSSRVWGPDVSRWQNKIDWKKVAKAGAAFAFCKASEGTGWQDPMFVTNWHGIKAAGIKVRGAYHYAHTDNAAAADAANFVEAVKSGGGFGPGDFAILDIEDVCDASKLVGPAATSKWVGIWLSEVMRLTGLPKTRVMVYTGQWWWGPRTGKSAVATEHPLWQSGYTAENKIPSCAPWKKRTFWQFTSTAKVPGVSGNCDVSIYYGTAADLHALAGITPVVPPVKPTPVKPTPVKPTPVKPTPVKPAPVKPGRPVRPVPKPEFYRVRVGDSLWKIGQKFGTTVKALVALNPQIKNPNLIFPGRKIRIR